MDSKVYIVTYAQYAKFAEADAIKPVYDFENIEKCPYCNQNLSGGKWIGKKIIKTFNKKSAPDFMYVYGGPDIPFLISERALAVLQKNSIKGIVGAELIDKVYLRKEVSDLKYYQIHLTRQRHPIDHKRSKIVYGSERPERKCKLCNPMGRTNDFIFGLYLDPEICIDMDIYTTFELGNTPLLSERFIQVCQENNLTGLYYEEITQHNSARGIFTDEEISKMLSKGN